jgi:hypothetical protein
MSSRHRDYENARRELEADLAADADTSGGVVFVPIKPRPQAAQQPALPPVTLRPGSHWAAAAFKAGREDEYIDGMQSRYGEEW